jgi:acetyl-CoA C-acetyltransferase
MSDSSFPAVPAPSSVVVVDAVRSPVGRRNGSLASVHPADLLATVLAALVTRTGIEPLEVGQVIGGCVGQVGAQASNVTRTAWLAAGLPLEVPATTVNVQCGSSQQALTLAHGAVAGGLVAVAVACGVEAMSVVPMGSTVPRDPDVGQPRAGRYADLYEVTTQFEGADRIAAKWGIGRAELDAFGLRSQQRAATAWAEDRFAGQIVAVPVDGRDVDRDECLRDSSLDALAALRTNLDGDGAFHTAGTSSQISDGAAAVLLTTEAYAARHGLRVRARLVDSVIVGSDPELMLTGPMPATRRLLERTGLSLDDIDLFEVNEAFASVVLAWQKELGVDPDRVNPNGGAIALGHPLGATGCVLLTKALYELERTGASRALVSMCCGGGLGTGTIIERSKA